MIGAQAAPGEQGATAYPALFSPLDIGAMRLRNRVVVSAHSTMYAEGNRVSGRHLAYYGARARGGAGLVVIGGLRVHPTTVGGPLAITVYDEACVPGLERLASVVHEGGARIVGQLLHMGRQRSGGPTEYPMWSASSLPCPVNREIPHAMTVAEMRELIAAYRRATRYCVQAGFDGIEISAAHGYLLQQFLSPYSNVRGDAYGGSLENRIRFPLEVVQACVEEAGDGFVVGVRISADEFVAGGLHLADMQEVAPRLVSAGADYLSVSHCTYSGLAHATVIPEMTTPPGAYTYLAKGIRDVVEGSAAVFAVGRILEPEHADQIIADGVGDAVALARAFIADPSWAEKARTGRAEEIRPCISCNQGCAGMIHLGRPMRCLTNPVTSRELEWGVHSPVRASTSRRVVVVGGGPAGLEAAVTAAERGHHVVLLERADELGGAARAAASLRGRDAFAGCYRYRVDRLAEFRVDVRLGVEATPDGIASERPDVVVVATGSTPAPVEVDGAAPGAALSVEEVLADPARVGPRVLLVDDDGHYRGSGVAEDLAARGHDVLIVTRLTTTAADLPAMNYGPQIDRLTRLRVGQATQRVLVRLDGARPVVRPAFGGPDEWLDAVDSVVVAGRRLPRNELADTLAEAPAGAEVHAVGDCLAPRDAMQAIRDGHAVARRL